MARLVRCPKCSKLILEYPEVPVYKCGGCNTVLRAKNARSSEESDAPGPLQPNQSDSISESSALKVVPSSLAATSNEGDASAESQALGSSSFIGEQNENKTTDQIIAKNQIVGSIGGDSKIDSNEQIDSSLKINEQISDIKSRDTTEHSSHSKQGSFSSKEDSLDRVPQDDVIDDVTRSPSAASSHTSHFYDGSISSDDGIKDRKLEPPKSRRTFKQKTHNDNVYQVRETRGDVIRNVKPDAYTDGEDQSRNMIRYSSKESAFSDILRSFKVVRDEVYSKYPIGNRDRGASFDLAEHPNEHSWIKQDEDMFHRSLSDGSALKSDLQDMEMLKKIEELKYRIIKLYGLNEYDKLTRGIDKERHYAYSSSGELNYRNRHPGNPLHRYDHHRMTSAGSAYDMYSISSDGGSSGKYNGDLERPKVNEKPKRRCRSFGNAAPFVVCYNCMELLQLPADLFISRKKPNKLKCGACNEVLTMSFASKAITRPQSPEVPCPTDKVDDTNNNKKNEGTSAFSYPSDHLYSDKVMGRLHLLMGYDSARDILYQADEGNEIGTISQSRFSTEKQAPTGSVRGSNAPSDSDEHRENNNAAKLSRSKRAGLPRP